MNQVNEAKGKSKLPVFKVQGDRTPVPDAEYTAKITSIVSDRYKNVRDCFKFSFEIVDGEFIGRQLTGWVNYPTGKAATVNMKIVRWYQAAKGHGIGEDDDLKLEELIGNVVVVKTKTNSTKFKNQFSNVEEILRLVTET
jgi:hypothetical protein